MGVGGGGPGGGPGRGFRVLVNLLRPRLWGVGCLVFVGGGGAGASETPSPSPAPAGGTGVPGWPGPSVDRKEEERRAARCGGAHMESQLLGGG